MLKSVAALALPGVAPFELGVVCELFGIDRTDTGGVKFDFKVFGLEAGEIPTNLGFSLQVQHGLEAAEDVDLLVVPAFGAGAEIPEVALDLMRRTHQRGAWLLSVCSGAFAFGAAGLLDGRRCTTHWMHSDELARQYPLAQVDPAVLYVEDDRIITSAGSAAGIDAGLYLIRCELGAGAAANTARRMVVPPHRDGGQAQYIDRPLMPVSADSLAEMLDWMAANLDQEQTVDELAARALMSSRTFARRFRAETGTTPAAWLTAQRLQRARELLESTELSVDVIAEKVGFGAGSVLRHHFSRSVGTTPLAYRRTFCGAGNMLESVSAR